MFVRSVKHRLARSLPPLTYFLLGVAFLGGIQTLVSKLRLHDKVKAAEQTGHSSEFHYVRFGLQEPEVLLPDTSKPLAPTRWCFGQRSKSQVLQLLTECGVGNAETESFAKTAEWQTCSNGLCALPSIEFVLALEPTARAKLYALLEKLPDNSAQRNPFRFRPESFMEWFADTGLGPEQLHTFERLLYLEGCSLSFCDGTVVQALFSQTDFHRLVKALYEERTFLMRLRIRPDTDIEGLLRYWGKGERGDVLRPLMESLAKAPGGGTLNVSYLLPPFARLRLYTYPKPSDSAVQNCFWTALNFFSETPKDQFADPATAVEVLRKNYNSTAHPLTMGDVVVIADEANRPVHMCVYLADEVVFTKNGKHRIDPWVLMKLPEVLAEYRAERPERISYFRARNIPQ